MQTALTNNGTTAPVAALKSLTELNKALGDGLRLQILRLLKSESFGVLELCRIIDMRQSALSHHLKILANANLVSTRREGNSIFYRRAFLSDDDPYRDIKESVFDQVDQLAIAKSAEKKISQIQSERAQQSLSFFNKNADKFHEKQGLIVAHDDYSSVLHDVIDSLGLSDKASVLEVGPGEGLLLTELATKFKKLIALDNSREMLDKSKQAIKQSKYNSVQFVLGDTAVARKQDINSDLIIFDMVLHHISSPAITFKDAAALLNDDGFLLIVDLSTHDQDWVRESCGDLWLGFDESDLNHWANKAGLVAGQSSYLGLRNGFQIQIRVFKKL
ncbi:MAG: metalloregulator ArsR/SmtB family transcription factor [Gammaproteobacteria bacterium]|nr:metalloregulator ArsR/SmtB family transcription factor [Gammaproteobacteria bacterium]MDD9895018.1 metalloregulator ArsR/SmtB family transcription factor [Gammaproteobacteria bacterium]MDD9958930.1 metalloregulator ArsR/SmtB family transcription factor [Gammaproteobacteria bacterium]